MKILTTIQMFVAVLAVLFSYSAFSELPKNCNDIKKVIDTRPLEIQLKEATNLLDNSMKYKKALDWFNAQTKTEDELQALASVKSPLDALAGAAKQRFIDGIVWRPNGIGGLFYGDLQELTPTQIYEILALVGAQYMVGSFKNAIIKTELDSMLMNDPRYLHDQDHDGYECSSRATCSVSYQKRCVTGNC